MATLTQVRGWSAERVREVAASLAARVAGLEGVSGRLGGRPSSWEGEAAGAAQERATAVLALVRGRVDELTAAVEALRAAAARLDEVADDLRAVERTLDEDGFALTEDGRVVDLRVGPAADTDAFDPQERLAAQVRAYGDVESLLGMAEDVDMRLGAALVGIADGRVGPGGPQGEETDPAAGAELGPPGPGDSDEVLLDPDRGAGLGPDEGSTPEPVPADGTASDTPDEEAAAEGPGSPAVPDATVSAAALVSPAATRDRDLGTRAHQAVGRVGAHVDKWGVAPVSAESRARYDRDERFADQVDDYAQRNDAGMLARDVLLDTGDERLARWVYDHPLEWAHEAAPFESPDGAPYVMDVPVQHSPRTLWARAATAVSAGYLGAARPAALRPRPSPQQLEVAARLRADEEVGPLLAGTTVEQEERALRIAAGHAYDKHVVGLDARGRPGRTPDMPEIASRRELARRVEATMWHRPRAVLERGRAVYHEPADGHVVIHDPASPDGGTTFRTTREGYVEAMVRRAAKERDDLAEQGLPPTSPPPDRWKELALEKGHVPPGALSARPWYALQGAHLVLEGPRR